MYVCETWKNKKIKSSNLVYAWKQYLFRRNILLIMLLNLIYYKRNVTKEILFWSENSESKRFTGCFFNHTDGNVWSDKRERKKSHMNNSINFADIFLLPQISYIFVSFPYGAVCYIFPHTSGEKYCMNIAFLWFQEASAISRKVRWFERKIVTHDFLNIKFPSQLYFYKGPAVYLFSTDKRLLLWKNILRLFLGFKARELEERGRRKGGKFNYFPVL